MKLLIVEDDNFYSQFITELLRDKGIESTRTQSAEEALAIDLTGYAGAIIDVMLPNDPLSSGITMEESRGGFNTGVPVARRVLQKKPKFPIVLLSSGVTGNEAEAWATENGIPFIYKSDKSETLIQALANLHLIDETRTPLAFIVHGHDETALLELKNYIQNTLGWQEPVVLREQPSSGKTIIEKFEDYSHQVDYVFVLLTPDDKTVSEGSNDEKRRSRQNVIFELGFFYGIFERRSGRILLLHKGPLELPSDTAGVVWIDISRGVNAAGEYIRRELGLSGTEVSVLRK